MNDQTKRIVSIGEVMIEMARGQDGRFSQACGGDTFNTAVYLARRGLPVAYATALGDDLYSDRIVALAAAEGIATDLIMRVPGRLPGLYLIETDAKGERTFHYWRDNAPARELFELPDWGRVAESIIGARIVYFSGITLSIYSNQGLGRFLALLELARKAGAKVVFDGNYRPRAWKGDVQRTRTVFMEALKRVDIALPTYDDEALLWGDLRRRDHRAAAGLWHRRDRDQERAEQRAGRGRRPQGIRAGAGCGGAGRHHRRRRQFQCRLHGGAARERKSGRCRDRRTQARIRSDPPSRRDHAAHGQRGALSRRSIRPFHRLRRITLRLPDSIATPAAINGSGRLATTRSHTTRAGMIGNS